MIANSLSPVTRSVTCLPCDRDRYHPHCVADVVVSVVKYRLWMFLMMTVVTVTMTPTFPYQSRYCCYYVQYHPLVVDRVYFRAMGYDDYWDDFYGCCCYCCCYCHHYYHRRCGRGYGWTLSSCCHNNNNDSNSKQQ